MEIRNLPTDWESPYLVVGHNIEGFMLNALLKKIREARDANSDFVWVTLDSPDAIIEFFPLHGLRKGDGWQSRP